MYIEFLNIKRDNPWKKMFYTVPGTQDYIEINRNYEKSAPEVALTTEANITSRF